MKLADVTLCAAASVNVEATVAAIVRTLQQVACARAVLFTDAEISLPDGIERIAIGPLRSAASYSRFVVRDLADWIDTSHCMIVQWDGFVLNPAAWDPRFLECDYIGAPWPQFGDGHDVGNGGFSIRSRRLMLACRDPDFVDAGEAEDVAIARTNRAMLEQRHGITFADRSLASHFSHERTGQGQATFGFHGVFNLPGAVGIDGFWDIYRSLDHKGTIRVDFWPLLRKVAQGPAGFRRAARMIADRLAG
ncbi:DUF5672 family protein [Novosphingobium olei]|uniref:DUF5672 family protein n=1 Tax=Novosphingobium olei TaxID=2728851 RepID=UPI0030881517|nr:hypothetical protein NSDW_29500 [Novosphingobium olei]